LKRMLPPMIAVLSCLAYSTPGAASVVTTNSDHVLVIDGQRTFPIGFTTAPPPDGKTPEGGPALEELVDAGAGFMRTGAFGGPWTEETFRSEDRWQQAAARSGMRCWVFLRELGSIGPDDTAKEALLRRVVERYRGHPGMGVWKGEDEPAWGRKPVPPLVRAAEIVKELDPDHPIAITQAPRHTVEQLRPYNAACDILLTDIYPVGYPPGKHSLLENNEISMAGDYTRKMMAVAQGQMPVWMVLQIAWSGVARPGKTLRFPTFAQERFMVYQSIINGARGLFFFGGNLTRAMTPEDAELGWNWRFWKRVLRPVIEEIGTHSPLYPALLEPDAPLPVQVQIKQAFEGEADPTEIEFCVRRTPEALSILACKREGATVQVEFSGLPTQVSVGDVMYEEPRKVTTAQGRFTDWFGPLEAHVYRFRLEAEPPPGQ